MGHIILFAHTFFPQDTKPNSSTLNSKRFFPKHVDYTVICERTDHLDMWLPYRFLPPNSMLEWGELTPLIWRNEDMGMSFPIIKRKPR